MVPVSVPVRVPLPVQWSHFCPRPHLIIFTSRAPHLCPAAPSPLPPSPSPLPSPFANIMPACASCLCFRLGLHPKAIEVGKTQVVQAVPKRMSGLLGAIVFVLRTLHFSTLVFPIDLINTHSQPKGSLQTVQDNKGDE